MKATYETKSGEDTNQAPDVDKARGIETSVNDYHTGAGWYVLPNGERVRGKEKAIDVLKGME